MKAILAILVLAFASSSLGSVIPNRCVADVDALLPSNDCSKYIACSNGIPSEMSCPDGLKFNLETLACDWDYNVDCENRFPEPPTPEFVPPFEALPNGCPVDFDINWLLPSRDCGNYLFCVFGETIERPCPPSLHFNYKEQTCDYPENAGCKST